MKYKTKVIIGAQWGDEGKGKISDYLAQKRIWLLDIKAEIMLVTQ